MKNPILNMMNKWPQWPLPEWIISFSYKLSNAKIYTSYVLEDFFYFYGICQDIIHISSSNLFWTFALFPFPRMPIE